MFVPSRDTSPKCQAIPAFKVQSIVEEHAAVVERRLTASANNKTRFSQSSIMMLRVNAESTTNPPVLRILDAGHRHPAN